MDAAARVWRTHASPLRRREHSSITLCLRRALGALKCEKRPLGVRCVFAPLVCVTTLSDTHTRTRPCAPASRSCGPMWPLMLQPLFYTTTLVPLAHTNVSLPIVCEVASHYGFPSGNSSTPASIDYYYNNTDARSYNHNITAARADSNALIPIVTYDHTISPLYVYYSLYSIYAALLDQIYFLWAASTLATPSPRTPLGVRVAPTPSTNARSPMTLQMSHPQRAPSTEDAMPRGVKAWA